MGSRLRSLVGIGVQRVRGRLTSTDSRRVLLTVCGVALAVALMTTVTGIALGLASGSTVQSEGVDYWVVPEQGSASSVAVSVEGPQLGAVHQVSARLSADDRVEYVTPVQLRILRVETGDRAEYVLAVGVIPPRDSRSVVGLPTASLTPGDPYYANGSYDGTWTGEAVLSDAAADLLHAESGTEMTVATGQSSRTFTVTESAQADLSSGMGPVPVMLVHLAELQDVTGAASGDQADQLLVSTSDPSVRDSLATIYPRTQVVARGGLGATTPSTSSLPLAVAITALLAALIVGTLFVATLMGLEVTADRPNLAALAAMGFSSRARSLIVLVETVSVAFVGGIVGVVLGAGAIGTTNVLVTHFVGVGSVAQFHVGLLGYGLGVALIIGFLAAPYPLWVSRHTDTLEVLTR